ncbi:MAG: hypothetical protein WCO84_03235 [bacterium]
MKNNPENPNIKQNSKEEEKLEYDKKFWIKMSLVLSLLFPEVSGGGCEKCS